MGTDSVLDLLLEEDSEVWRWTVWSTCANLVSPAHLVRGFWRSSLQPVRVPRRVENRCLNKSEELCFLEAVVRRGRDFDLAILVLGHVAYTLHDANINSACR